MVTKAPDQMVSSNAMVTKAPDQMVSQYVVTGPLRWSWIRLLFV